MLRVVRWNILGIILALILGEVTLRYIGIIGIKPKLSPYPSQVKIAGPDTVRPRARYIVDRQLFWIPKNYSAKVAYWTGRRPTIVSMGDSCRRTVSIPTIYILGS